MGPSGGKGGKGWAGGIRIRNRALSTKPQPRSFAVVDKSQIMEHAEVIGADGVHIGTVDHVAKGPDGGERIKLTRTDSPQGPDGEGAKHHYIPIGLVADIEDGKLRLSANADVVADLFEEAD